MNRPIAFIPVALLLTGLWLVPAASAGADSDALAHRLYASGDYTRAAELFTDPAWKGVALYRSGQWWRAAEAFVRANDTGSLFNLGNSYARLGYFELALEAYQNTLAREPGHAAAGANAALMRELLAENEEDGGEQSSGTASEQQAIDQLPADEQAAPQSGSGGHEDSDDTAPGTQGDTDDTAVPEGGTRDDAPQGPGGQPGERDAPQPETGQASDVQGRATAEPVAEQVSGSAEDGSAGEDSAAAGLRRDLERERATDQWLNRIRHDPGRYLQKRIELEIRRRQAAGQSAPAGGSLW